MTTKQTRRTRQDADVRADAIVLAASKLFAVRGFRGATIAAVAAEVGLTDAGVLHHFPTKRALLGAVLERSTLENAPGFRRLIDAGGIEALEGLAEWGRVMSEDSGLTMLEITLGAEALEPGSDLRPFFQTRYRVLRRWLIRAIDKGIARGEFRADADAEREATALIAFLDGIRLQWAFGFVDSLEDAVRAHVRARIEHLRPADATSDGLVQPAGPKISSERK